MGHFDYHCCAVCDGKIAYSGDAETKERLCSWCAVELAQRGVFAHSVAELKEWMRTTPPAVVVETLDSAGFKKCLDPQNDVDSMYAQARNSASAQA